MAKVGVLCQDKNESIRVIKRIELWSMKMV